MTALNFLLIFEAVLPWHVFATVDQPKQSSPSRTLRADNEDHNDEEDEDDQYRVAAQDRHLASVAATPFGILQPQSGRATTRLPF